MNDKTENRRSIKIWLRDGSVDTWSPDSYTEYKLTEYYFVIIDGCQWVGMYNRDDFYKVVVLNDFDGVSGMGVVLVPAE